MAVRAQNGSSLDVAQARVLRVLNYGGMLMERQVKVSARLTGWATRQALAKLGKRGLIMTSSARPGRYQITRSGQNMLAACIPEFGRLDG